MLARSVRAALCALPVIAAPATGLQQADRAAIERAIDSLALPPIAASRAAGMAIAVLRGADTLLLKGYGYADLELSAPMPRDAVFEIGSVTKQFTAAAVFQLRDRGLLGLDDEITRFLPAYPTQGHRVTVRQLLSHTSGIMGYTEIPGIVDRMAMRDLPRDSLVAIFGPLPFDFEPGAEMIYNNSGYFLLGLIIEKASGERYEDYVRTHLFQPAGMNGSLYCPDYTLVSRRAHGYETARGSLQRARPILQIWPYAAGSLCSTAGDLAAWNRALHGARGQGGSILSAAGYREFITPGTLNDGTRLRYANGVTLTDEGGRRQISHGGGIFGFLSELRCYPDQDLSIVVLMNSMGPVGPSEIADRIEALLLGKRAEEPPAPPFPGDLASLAGTYEGPGRGGPFSVVVTADSAGLRVKAGRGSPQPIRFLGGLTFARGAVRYTFVRDGGRVTGLRLDQVTGYYLLKRTQSQ